MSLRQRPARTTAGLDPSGSSEQPSIATSAATNGSAQASRSRKPIRLNKVLGRIVPVILLVYVGYSYDLVVRSYGFRYLYSQQKRTLTPILWLLPTHALFFWSLRAYLRVFFAHSQRPAGVRNNGRGVISWLRDSLGATFPDPDQAQQQDEKAVAASVLMLLKETPCSDVRVELCQPDGQPLRCWRDRCRGRIKTFRTRHCGDCGVCRIGFDHHCAWFDNDVTAAATLRPFVGFLVSIPPLYLLGFAPLFPTAWRVLARIQSFSKNDVGLRNAWWSKWYSWIGGPAFRWMVGFGLGASRWAKATPGRLPHESPRAPVLAALGAVFVFVAIALATSSLTLLQYGRLTIDVERAKAFRKLQRQLANLEKSDNRSEAKVAAIQQKMESLAPVQHFKVSWQEPVSSERKERIVLLTTDEGLLSHGSPWTNVKRLLGMSTHTKPTWTLPDTALRKVLEKASLLPPAQ